MAENNKALWRGVRNALGDAGIEVVQDTPVDLQATITPTAALQTLLEKVRDTPRGDVGTQVNVSGSQVNAGTAVLYTVAAGKTLYLTHFNALFTLAASAATGHLAVRNAAGVVQFYLLYNIAYTTLGNYSFAQACPKAVKIPTGYDVAIICAANAALAATIHGWVE